METIVNETREWLEKKVEEQKDIPSYKDPKLTKLIISDKFEILREKFEEFIDKPDPAEVLIFHPNDISIGGKKGNEANGEKSRKS